MAVIEELHDCFIDFLGMVVVVFKAGNDNDPHFVLNIAELSLGCDFWFCVIFFVVVEDIPFDEVF